MKPPKIEPGWMSAIGLWVAPLICGLNATVVALVTRDIDLKQVVGFLFGVAVFAFLACFPLGLLCEHLVQLWNCGQFQKSRLRSALYGGCALLLLVILILVGASGLVVLAALSIPFLWSLLLILFALFARPPQS